PRASGTPTSRPSPPARRRAWRTRDRPPPGRRSAAWRGATRRSPPRGGGRRGGRRPGGGSLSCSRCSLFFSLVSLRSSLASELLDREAPDVRLGARRVEDLAHDDDRPGGRLRRREARFAHELRRVGGEEHLARDLRVVELALHLTPAFHLREDPDGEGMPG